MAPGAYPLHPYAQTRRGNIPYLARTYSDAADARLERASRRDRARARSECARQRSQVGYIAGDNDPLPETLRQIGIQVDLLDEVALAFGDLSHYDAIVVGIRAYELRPDLPRMNWRLLDYVADGGTLVVQYQRDFAWNSLLPAPFLGENGGPGRCA